MAYSCLVAGLLGCSVMLSAQDDMRGPDRSRSMTRPTRSVGSPESRFTTPMGSPMTTRDLHRPDSWITPPRRVLLAPPALERCRVVPTELVWQRRDIMREIQHMARRGLIPVIPVSGLVDALEDTAIFPAGWKAYGFVVPAKGELEVRLTHPNLGWFRLMMVNKWGSLQEGMLQNLIPKGYPVVTFKNPKNSPQEVFVIADDPGWMSTKADPYTITIKRSWDTQKDGPDPMPQTVGIWAKNGSVDAASRTPARLH